MKKMMISTALATSLIAGVASAETKVKAYIETTLGSGETPATSNQVNQNGGYTNKTPKMFIKEILNISKKSKFDSKKLYLGGDHLGPLPWKKENTKTAIKNSISLINQFLKYNFCKIHIDTSIKCKDDKYINSEIIFNRTNKILNDFNIKKKLKINFQSQEPKFLYPVVGTIIKQLKLAKNKLYQRLQNLKKF